MVEFDGLISKESNMETIKLRTKNKGILFLIINLIISSIALVVGILNNTLIYSFILILALAIITILLFIPNMRFAKIPINVKIQITDTTISQTSAYNNIVINKQKIKPLSKVKKCIDYGNWYCIIFKYGGIDTCWVCQKNLLTKGSI